VAGIAAKGVARCEQAEDQKGVQQPIGMVTSSLKAIEFRAAAKVAW
jgi:hypothetical protein